ncbi:hypothetical protein HKCCE3408_09545 [Rhodobacterales bacterium HKCCE3408]|nr:hypothetical protein [Rhodobacterales bacterium HKCCE3408]
MARKTTKQPDQTEGTDDTTEAETAAAATETTDPGDSVAADSVEGTPASDAETVMGDDSIVASEAEESTDAGDTPAADDAATAPVAATPTTMDEPRRDGGGPGFLPLLFGGILAGAIGYGAAYFVYSPTPSFDVARLTELADTLAAQDERLSTLNERTDALESDLGAIEPGEATDLSGVEGGITDLAARLDSIETTLSDLDGRVSELESRPLLTGDGSTDGAAMAAAIEELRGELSAQQDQNAAMAEEIRATADEAAARIADAEDRATASIGTATAQAALSELRIALAAGTPFAGPLADVADAEGLEVPAALSDAAESGIPTLEEIQTRFPAAARAALPVAYRETAGDSAGERFTAFLRGNFGGRSLEPLEGDGPDAILSRIGAAVDVGDLDTALEEVSSLPEAAQDEMANWTALVRNRAEALNAFDGLAGALGGN